MLLWFLTFWRGVGARILHLKNGYGEMVEYQVHSEAIWQKMVANHTLCYHGAPPVAAGLGWIGCGVYRGWTNKRKSRGRSRMHSTGSGASL
jgi:hypothetical protein